MYLATDVAEATDMNDAIMRIAEFRDRDAFSQIYEFFSPRLKNYFIAKGMNDTFAEELVQETMLKIWRKSKQFNPEKASASTWIFTIARNLHIDSLRKNRLPIVNIDEIAEKANEELSPEDRIDLNQRQDNVVRALSRLPSAQSKVVYMSFFEDKSHGEISEELRIPLGTVKSRMRLAFEPVSYTHLTLPTNREV